MDWAEEFRTQSALRLQENVPRIQKCFAQLKHKEIWYSPNQQSNSIGHLILHLCGNITQYIQASLGGEQDKRERDLEFSSSEKLSAEALLEKLKTVVNKAELIILKCSETELLKERKVQAFNLSGIGVIIHVVEHFSYHTGQIAYYTKELKNKDLQFYEGLDLDGLNSSE
jgi:uncharacterized damage-inducible protein DinB